jgi:drug/metabolite transporter (DMT)-like permease
VLPYRRSWSSGVLARAHALGTLSIVTDVGGLSEQAEPGDEVVADDAALAAAMAGVGAAPHRPRVASAVGAGQTSRHRRLTKGTVMLLGLILVSVTLSAVAQLTLKHGINQVTAHGAHPLSLKDPAGTASRIASDIGIWLGLLTFGVSAVVWLVVLSRASLSFAYPFASLTYVIILVFDRSVLGQQITAPRYAGVALIVAGIVLVSRTHAA